MATLSLTASASFPVTWYINHVAYVFDPAYLPSPWSSSDVGAVGTVGCAYQGFDGDLFVAGAGSDIWRTADSFRFVYQSIDDGDIFAIAP
jgi:hypothetical protein